MAEFEFAAEFTRNPRTTVSFEVNGEQFDIIVPRDGRLAPLILSVDLEDMMAFFAIALDAESADRFDDLVYDFEAGLEIHQVTLLYHHAIVLVTGGAPYWATQRLIAAAITDWTHFLGDMTREGVQPLALPLHELAAAVYSWLTEGADKASRDKFDKDLAATPPGVEVEILEEQPEWQSAGTDFMAQMAMRGGKRTGEA